MHIDKALRLIAGSFILITLLLSQLHSEYWLLSQLHSEYWLLFTAFVGLNLVQSFFSNWCPMMTFLKWFGLKRNTTTQVCK